MGEGPSSERPFPAFTVAGGLIGAVGAALTGGLILVPAALVVGAVVDVRARCGVCGHDIAEKEAAFRLMDERMDEFGRRSYRPFQHPRPPFQERDSLRPPLDQGIWHDPLDPVHDASSRERSPEFVYDPAQGLLVVVEHSIDADSASTIGEMDLDFGGMDASGDADASFGSFGDFGDSGGADGGADGSAGGGAE